MRVTVELELERPSGWRGMARELEPGDPLIDHLVEVSAEVDLQADGFYSIEAHMLTLVHPNQPWRPARWHVVLGELNMHERAQADERLLEEARRVATGDAQGYGDDVRDARAGR